MATTTATKTVRERVADMADAELKLKIEWWNGMTPTERQAAFKFAWDMGGQETIESAWQHWKRKVLHERKFGTKVDDVSDSKGSE